METKELLLSGVSVATLVVLIVDVVLKPLLRQLESKYWLIISIVLTMILGMLAIWLTEGWPTTPEGWANAVLAVFVYALAVGKGYDEVKAYTRNYKATH